MTKLQKITADLSQLPPIFESQEHGTRVETGPLQINDDWPGTFIRGDNAAYYAMMLGQLLAVHKEQNTDYEPFQNSMAWAVMQSLYEDLRGSNVRNLNRDVVEENDEDVGC